MKGGETLRETHPPLWLLIGRISINFLKCGKQKTQHLRSRLDLLQFSRVKNIVGFSDWPELIFVRKFTTKRLSKYIAVCIKQVLKLFCKCYLHS